MEIFRVRRKSQMDKGSDLVLEEHPFPECIIGESDNFSFIEFLIKEFKY